MNKKIASTVCILLAIALAQRAHAMVRHIAMFVPPVALDEFDTWYFGTHSQECMRYYGPWLRRYETYRSADVSAEANTYNVYRGRYTELWYESVNARSSKPTQMRDRIRRRHSAGSPRASSRRRGFSFRRCRRRTCSAKRRP